MIKAIPKDFKIPSNISYSQGEFIWDPEFKSDFDLAVYYAGKRPFPESKGQKKVLKWLNSLGLSFEEIKAHRKKIIDKLRQLTNAKGAGKNYPVVVVPPIPQSFKIDDKKDEEEDDSVLNDLDDLLNEIKSEEPESKKDKEEDNTEENKTEENKTEEDKPEQPKSEESNNLSTDKKESEDLVEEEIDSRILEILGLTEVSDFTYGEYKTLLRERAAAGRMGASDMSTETIELVTNEFKRVKNKEEGKFKIKPKTINISSVFNKKSPSPQKQQLDPKKLLPQGEEKKNADLESVEKQSGLDKVLASILGTLNDIKSLLNDQLNADKQAAENIRKRQEISRKRRREDESESKQSGKDADVKALTLPAFSFFDTIKRYFGNILAGSFVVGLLKWLTDPANKKSVDNFKEFFINQGPLILGGILALALLPVASTLLSFTGAILGGVSSLISNIPKLKAAILSLTTAAVAAAAGALVPKLFPESVNQQERKTLDTLEKKYKGDKQKMIKDLKAQKGNLNMLQIVQGVGSEIDEQISFLESGRTKMYGSTGEDLILQELEKRGLPKEQLEFLKEIYKLDKAPKGSEKLQSEADKKRAEELSSMTPEKLKELFEKGKSLDLFKAYKGKGSDSVKIPGLGTIVAGTNWFGGRQRKYFDENGKEMTEEEMNQKYRLYSAVLEKRKRDKENKKQPPQPTTPLMPGLPPSAAQPGTGPVGNQVGTPSASASLSRAASQLKGMSSAAGPDGGRNGCVWAVNKVFSQAGIQTPWGSSNYVPDAESKMIQSGYQQVSSPLPGDLYIAPGQKHVGIVLDNGNIISNSSSKASFSWEDTPQAYASYYGGQGKFYRIPPSVTASGGQVQLSPTTTPGTSITPGTPTFMAPFKMPQGAAGPSPIPSQGTSGAAGGSSSSPGQAKVPSFSSEDPNNVTTMVVKGIYNVVG